MKQLENLQNKVETFLGKVAYFISLVWFLIPVATYYSLKKTVLYLEDDPAKADFYLNMYFFTLLLFIIAGICLIYRRKSVQLCIAAFIGVLMLIVTFFLSFAVMSAPTGFAQEHPIPEGLEYHTPLNRDANLEEGVCESDSTTYLQIRNENQGGIYEYSFFYPQLPEGSIFLRCYEVTENLPLSEDRIKKASMQETKGSSHIACHVNCKRFTIYEGDWGEYYAARIEVWFKDTKGRERKLLEKIYAVEGWMR